MERCGLPEYELVMVLSPEVDEDGAAQTVEQVKQFVTQGGGSVTQEEHLGKRKLAYQINRFDEGNYFLTRMQMDASMVKGLDDTIKITEEVIRHILVKVDR